MESNLELSRLEKESGLESDELHRLKSMCVTTERGLSGYKQYLKNAITYKRIAANDVIYINESVITSRQQPVDYPLQETWEIEPKQAAHIEECLACDIVSWVVTNPIKTLLLLFVMTLLVSCGG